MRTLGDLQLSPRRLPFWHTPHCNVVSLAQFRDNVFVGARGKSAPREMQRVCTLLSQVWQLPVLCECMTGTCMNPSLTAMGFTTHLHSQCPPLIYARPSGLTNWHLKYTVTLQTPTTTAHKHISNIMVGAVLNLEPFLHSWISCLLSSTAWAQLACLSGYSRSAVLRAMHSAVPRIMSRAVWDVDSTLDWCKHVTYILAATRDTIFFRLHRWIQHIPYWHRGTYASWHMPHPKLCSDICADWCFDFPVLHSLTPLLNPSTSICLGQRPRGVGGPLFLF